MDVYIRETKWHSYEYVYTYVYRVSFLKVEWLVPCKNANTKERKRERERTEVENRVREFSTRNKNYV